MTKWILTALFALLFSISPPTLLLADHGTCCCFDPCARGPLCCGEFSLLAKGGIAPSSYSRRDKVWLTLPAADPAVISVNSMADFSNQFRTPWTIGAEIGWNASKRIQFFLEYAFMQAKGKQYNFSEEGFAFGELFSNFQANSLWVGARFYFDSCCWECLRGRVAPYIGVKAGFSWQKEVSFGLTLNGAFLQTSPYSFNQTAVSTGWQAGVEWWLWECASLIFQAEFVATQGMRPNRNVVIDTPQQAAGITNINLGDMGWLISFPITLGLRYTF